MENNEADENLATFGSSEVVFDAKTPNLDFGVDENSPPSPGEVPMMRNHPKVASVLFSPARRALGKTEEKKIKPKTFSSNIGIYTSPKGKTKFLPTEKRKTLQVLQPTANGDGTLVGSHGVVRRSAELKSKKNKPAPSKTKQQKLKLKPSESSTSPTCTDSSDSDTVVVPEKNVKETKSEAEVKEEAIAMLVSARPPEKYWELLAEERRLALQEALEENERLHKELEEMKERNKALEEVAGQAEYFASLYQMVMEGEVPDTELSGDATDEG